jgi:hypothetical protein
MTRTNRRTFARTMMGAALAAVLAPVVVAATANDVRADDVPYVECKWAPFNEAWACSLPATFTQGRFTAPPDFRHDDHSVQTRQHAWAQAKTEADARTQGHVGVFVPQKDKSWVFVPGVSWSPGDPVFLPPGKTGKGKH